MFRKRKNRAYYAELLAERASQQKKRDVSAAEIIDVVSLGDPSEDLSYLDWMLEFIHGIGGGMGDTLNLSRIVSLHHEIKDLLPARRRELRGLRSVNDVIEILSPYFRDGLAFFGDELEQYRRNALDESELIYEDQDYLIVCPRTKSAAIFWCSRTNWTFDIFTLRSQDVLGRLEPPDRHLESPYLIFISKKSGEKIIAGITPPFCRDRNGKPASFWTFLDRHRVLNVLGTWLLRKSPEFSTTMPAQYLTREIASILVEKHDKIISHLPEHLLDRDLYIQAIKKDCANIACVPESELDLEIYNIYIDQTESNLKVVPAKFLDRGICLKSIRSNPRNLKSVPAEFLDAEFCDQALQANPFVLSEFPREMITGDRCIKAIEGGGIVLTKALDEFLDREICEKSVEWHPYLLERVPDRFLDKALVRRAIQRSGRALKHVRPGFRDLELCVEAVNQDPAAIAYVPRDILDRDLLLSAIGRDSSNLSSLPAELKDEEVCRVAMRSNLNAARYVPREILRNLVAEFEPEYAKRETLVGPRATVWDSYALEFAELKARLASL
jgi:hypothetical protein